MTRTGKLIAALSLTLVCWTASPALSAPGAKSFPSPEAAVDALVASLRSGNIHDTYEILGPGSAKLLDSGDRVADKDARLKFIAAYDAQHALVQAGGHRILHVGRNDWPLPLPIVGGEGAWHFDSVAGAQEMVDRRIGENELAAIRASLAYYDAQNLYFELAREQFGAGFYAQRFISTPGRYDGLYWPTEADAPASPIGPLVAQAMAEGYGQELISGRQTPYHGYYFRVLTAQGKSAPGGAGKYIVDGKMVAGFALLAWPAIYGASGITSFEIGADGVLYQRDLGPDTARIAGRIVRYDPDLSWVRVDVTQ